LTDLCINFAITRAADAGLLMWANEGPVAEVSKATCIRLKC